MLLYIKKKHALIYLGILLVFGLFFVSKCLEDFGKSSETTQKRNSLSYLQINENIMSSSVITRRAAFSLIKKQKLKNFITPLFNLVISGKHTEEDRMLMSNIIGTIGNINTVKAVLGYLKNERFSQHYLPFLEIIYSFLNYNSANQFLELRDEIKVLLTILKNSESSAVKKYILDIIAKSKYIDAFETVLGKFQDYALRAQVITTLAVIVNPDRNILVNRNNLETSQRIMTEGETSTNAGTGQINQNPLRETNASYVVNQKEYLITLLRGLLSMEANKKVRRAAKVALYYIEKNQVFSDFELINYISDLGSKEYQIREKTLKHILELKKDKLINYIKLMLSVMEKRIQLMALEVIGIRKLKEFESDIDKLLGDMLNFPFQDNEYLIAIDCANAAIIALSKIGTEEAFKIIKKYFFDDRIKQSAYIALSRFDIKNTIEFLETNFYKENEILISTIADILFSKKKYEIFLNNLTSASDYIRAIAIKYTSLINSEIARNALKKACDIEYSPKWKKIYELALLGEL